MILKLNLDWSSQEKVLHSYSGIYFIRNIINNKVYIGSSSNIYRRYLCHRQRLLTDKHHCKHLQNSVNKYGINNFEFKIIAKCPKQRVYLEKLENHFLKNIKNKYNTTDTSSNGTGKILTNIHKENISKGNMGKIVSEITKLKIKESNMGRVPSNKGKPMTEEQKIKISIGNKGKKISQKHKDKLSLLNKGNTLSKESIEKCKESSRIYWLANKGKTNKYLKIKSMLSDGFLPLYIMNTLKVSASYISKIKNEK
jgi:group I intron endonuclease